MGYSVNELKALYNYEGMSISVGQEGEEHAANFLKKKGYEIVERNYRYKRFEIDIIAKINEELVFVEVKTKSYTTFGNPEDSVSSGQAIRIMEAAEDYIYSIDWQRGIRFDVIAIEKSNGTFMTSHFEDAFH